MKRERVRRLERERPPAHAGDDLGAQVFKSVFSELLARPIAAKDIAQDAFRTFGADKNATRSSIWRATMGVFESLIYPPAMHDALQKRVWTKGKSGFHRHPNSGVSSNPAVGLALDTVVAGLARRGHFVVGGKGMPSVVDPANPFHQVWLLHREMAPFAVEASDHDTPKEVVLDLYRRQMVGVVHSMHKAIQVILGDVSPMVPINSVAQIRAMLISNRRMLEVAGAISFEQIPGRPEMPVVIGGKMVGEDMRYLGFKDEPGGRMPVLGYSEMRLPSDSDGARLSADFPDVFALPDHPIQSTLAAAVLARNRMYAGLGLSGGTLSLSGMEALVVLATREALPYLLRDPELAPLLDGVKGAPSPLDFGLDVRFPLRPI